MSVMQTQKTAPLQFYRSSPAPCPYLPGRIERKLFARLGGGGSVAVNSVLSHAGFRRSHDIIYKPACPGCMACVAVRVPVNQFEPQGSLERIRRRGAHLTLETLPPEPTRAQYDLFMEYETRRHADSDMARMSYDDYCSMLTEGEADTHLLTLAEGDKLMGAMLADRLADGWSAVYSFYATTPEADRLSLGSFLILRLIEEAKNASLPYVYLGYWVQNSRKMDYKSRFRPLEMLGPNGWQLFTPSDT
jgi:arginine-tRNA-protein transferase